MGRMSGISVMAIFGALWVNLGLHLAHASPPWAGPAAGVVALALIGLAVWRRRRGGEAPRPRVDRRLVWLGMGGEVVLILVGVNLLSALHRDDLLTPVLAVIVGLHFLPLARAFSVPAYTPTGVALTAVGLVGFALHGEVRPLVVGLGAAVVLWLACAGLIARRWRTAD